MRGPQKALSKKCGGRSFQGEETASAKGPERVHCIGGMAELPADQSKLKGH